MTKMTVFSAAEEIKNEKFKIKNVKDEKVREKFIHRNEISVPLQCQTERSRTGGY